MECIDVFNDRMSKASNGRYDGPEAEIEALQYALTEFDSFACTDLPRIQPDLVRALSTPAAHSTIEAAVAGLCAVFPNIHNRDLTIFMQQLVSFLEDWEIKEGVLDLAVRDLMLTCDYLPTISKVREALTGADGRLSKFSDRLIGDCGIYFYRSTLTYKIESLDGTAAKRREHEAEQQRLEYERRAQEERAKLDREAEARYRAMQDWGFDMIAATLTNPEHDADTMKQQVTRILEAVAAVRVKWEYLKS